MKYIAKRGYKKKPLRQRIEDNIFYSPDGCWYWTGSVNNTGYGIIGYEYKTEVVTRAYYRIMKGDFDKTLLICHHCDNPLCINPEHLFTGTYKDNTADMIKKGRMAINNGAKCGSVKLTEDEVREIISLRKHEKYDDIAKRFNVTKSAITSIFYGYSWRHLNLRRERKNSKFSMICAAPLNQEP